MNTPLSVPAKLPGIGTSIFTVMSALANESGAINLSQGFPDYDPPAELIDLSCHYLRSGKNQYAPMAGVMELREKIAAKVAALYQRSVDPVQEITITAGSYSPVMKSYSWSRPMTATGRR